MRAWLVIFPVHRKEGSRKNLPRRGFPSTALFTQLTASSPALEAFPFSSFPGPCPPFPIIFSLAEILI